MGLLIGQQLEKKLEVESEQAYHSRDETRYAPDCTQAMNLVRKHTNLLASTLDRFDALHRESMMEIIWKRQLSELEQAMKTVRLILLLLKTRISIGSDNNNNNNS